ncbi:HPr kinase/phosphorylase [Runella sp.]|uniref:HPr kinase/phosphorylase n=1 Tax=Runella sp. TaxID=1960881 RepID=UPI003D14C6C0
MHIYECVGGSIKSPIFFPELVEKTPDISSFFVTVSYDPLELPETASRISAYWVDTETFFFRWDNQVACTVCRDTVKVHSEITTEFQRMILLKYGIGTALFLRGYYLLHGSAVLLNNKTFVFIGESGAGKSTTASAFVRAGGQLVADDLVVFERVGPNGATVSSFIKQSKLWEDSAHEFQFAERNKLYSNALRGDKYGFIWQGQELKNCPVDSVYCLYPPSLGEKPSLLTGGEAFLELIKHFPLVKECLVKDRMLTHFQQTKQLLEHVKLLKFPRPDSYQALKTWVEQVSQQEEIVH